MDVEAIKEIIDEAQEQGECPEEALRKWIRTGEAPKALYDAIYRFSTNPDKAFDFVEWDEVVAHFSSLGI
jgi:hypothetical protein